ncbi:MAG: ABC transporter ATP-binding protein/permease [Bifidobacteriaceae bacterium]|jgi:ABC-type multidrug transport system fused ATPase/permease subunit|nr:ABC transporter ATP-binding protein/permease [Bifidobacteriaceae bacterium]
MLIAVLMAESCFTFAPVLAFGYLVQHGVTGSLSAEVLWTLISVVAVSSVASQVLRGLLDVLSERLGRLVGAELDLQAAEALSDQETLDWLAQPRLSAALANAFGPAARTTELHTAFAATFRLALLETQALLCGVLLAVLDPLLGVLTTICYWALSRKTTAEYSVEQSQLYGEGALRPRGDYFRNLAMSGTALKEIRVFGLSDWLLQHFSAENAPTPLPARTVRATLQIIGLSSLAATAQAFLFVRLAQSTVDVGDRAGVLMLASSALAGLMGLLSLTMDLLYRREGLRRLPAIFDVLSILRGEDESAPAGTTEEHPVGPVGDLVLDDVWYRYPGSERWVLRGVSFAVRTGQTVGIVGVNGAGKSTLVKVLCGMLAPEKGDLLMGDTSISDVGRPSWQRRFAVVLQRFGRYPMSLRENVMLGGPAVATENLPGVSERAGIMNLPGGDMSETGPVLSNKFPGGVELSGGQWQRVAVARALVATETGAQFLVMDEPTAALDPRAEARFYDAVIDSSECTTFLISHRFATVRRADVIMVLADGKISEAGSHHELMELGGLYARMFAEQAAKFDLNEEA